MNRISLCEGWLFRKLPDRSINQVDFSSLPTDGFEAVTLPHTWYTDDDQYRGLAVYRRSLSWEPGWERVFLSFEGAEQRCRVYADGIFLTEHCGAYSRFRVPLTRPASGVTELTVLLDNRLDETISPHFGDFTIFGGLYRPVSLIIAKEICFDYTYYGTDGLLVRTFLDEEGNGHLRLEPHALGEENTKIRYTVFGPAGTVVVKAETSFADIAELTVKAPALWNGRKDVVLYTIQADLLYGGEFKDTVSVKTGFRCVSLSASEGLTLNGQKIKLHGVAKHQDIGTSWNAVTSAQINADFDLIDEIGANAVRLSHYQHAQTAYELCDERGLLAWAEIPMLKMTENQALFENTALQLRELILQNIHHPSIFCWGIQNEIAMFRDAPYMHEQCEKLCSIVRELDPVRFSACANLYPLKPSSKLNNITDLVGYNIYFGWYYGEMADYGTYLDRFHAAAPQVPLGISEYGVDANTALHAGNPQVKDYSEEYQALFHETVYPLLEARQWLWGSFIWNMFDFSSSRRNEGGIRFVNAKGLVTRDRKIKKDAFYYYKARWSDEPFVHLCGKRFEKRCCESTDVKVYTNQPEVSLAVNGELFATTKNDGNGTVVFKGVPLKPGENRLDAFSGELKDTLVWQRVDTPEESYSLPDSGNGQAVKNWFLSNDDITRQGYFSINDTANDVLENQEACEVLKKYVPALAKALLTTDSIPLGLSMRSILSYGNPPVDPEIVKSINKELNQIENLF